MIHEGRPSAGMPAFKNLGEADMSAIVAFLHSQMDTFAEAKGGRRTVDPSDLATGNAEAGRAYFNGPGNCSSCHSPTGDLAGIGTRLKGLNLMRRMLYPGGPPGSGDTAQAKATIQLTSGETVTGPLMAEDDFSVTIRDASGARKIYQRSAAANIKIDDPISAHFDQLGKYTDADMHNVYAYLESLK